MTQGLPPKPTCISIVGGILLAVLVLAAFALLPHLVKWVGAVFTFIPSRLGLVQVVTPDEVLPVDVSDSPTVVVFARPGAYALFTSNYDLLSINEAVLAAQAKPWFKLTGGDGHEVPVILIERGLAFYDTPFARGRPVARFEIEAAGTFSMTHPSRPDFVYMVPDYTKGAEDAIGMYMLLQVLALGVGGWYLRRKTRRPRTVVVVPPPSRATRARFMAGQASSDQAMPSPLARQRSWESHLPVPVAEAAPPEGARDVLRMLHQNEITVQQAEQEVEAQLFSRPAGRQTSEWGLQLALTPSEAAAYSQGARISDLLALRYEGWPAACVKCGQPVDHQQLRWWLVRDEQGRPALRHIDCPQNKT